MRVAALCGGVGAAKLLRGLAALDLDDLAAIVNVGDDCDLHGLAISPDLDTITYTVGGSVNPSTGWGLVDETWAAMGALARFEEVRPPGSEAGGTWFGLGDRDLATHLYRTGRRAEGAPLSTISDEIARAFGLRLRLLPATDDRLRTVVEVDGEALDFQRWFVGRRHQGTVGRIDIAGAATATPGPGVLEAIAEADRVVVCPSNPLVSIAPVLAVPGLEAAVVARREHVIAVSPIIGGAALKGPAGTLLEDLGHDVSAVGVARLYAHLAGTLVVDEVDADLVDEVEATGMRCVVAPTVMHDVAASTALARVVLA